MCANLCSYKYIDVLCKCSYDILTFANIKQIKSVGTEIENREFWQILSIKSKNFFSN